MQIASITTNEQGEYEYATEEDYLEQTLDFIIQKEGFEIKNISYEIDKAEIKSDILLSELEKGTKEKTRIFGTIRNSKNRDPVNNASITLSIEGSEIASVSSNEQGEYEYTAEEDYIGQTLDYVIQKEGFIRQDISYEIERFEIESDFLMDEIEIEIKGKICDETDSPLDNASISFSIGGSTIDLVSDKNGSFSFTIGQQFLNQTIGYEVNKEGFKIKSGKLKLIEYLECINLFKDTPIDHDIKRWIRVAAVGIVLTGLSIFLFGLPTGLLVSPDYIDFGTIHPGDNVVNKEISISKEGWGKIDWVISKNEDWITVIPTSGFNSDTINVSIDKTGLNTGNYNGNIMIASKGGLFSKFYSETKIINVYLNISTTTGSITITSTPPESSIYLDDSYEATTPKTISGVPAGSHIIRITKSGYKDFIEQVTVTAGETETVSANLVEQTGAAIYVSSDPSGANILLDGTHKGTTPMTIDKVIEGSHTIEITKSGHEDYNEQVTVTAGETKIVYANLVEQTGAISVSSIPSEADIYLDGIYKGTTPMTIYNVIEGSYNIEITESEYENYSEQVTVTAGETEIVYANLIEQTGAIDVSSIPSEADIYLDGIYKGTTPMTIDNVIEGSYTIEITESEYENYSEQVTVTAGETENVSANLVEQTGAIYVSSIPSEANIYLDGINKGTTSMTIENVIEDSYTIVIAKSGYENYSEQVTVTAGETASIFVELEVGEIPLPELVFIGSEQVEVRGNQFIRYYFSIENWAEYPAILFESAPDLPPCGLNTEASRTWVNFYDAENDKRISGNCGVSSPETLASFRGFGVMLGLTPPEVIYVELEDRREDKKYRSNEVNI